MILHLSEEQFNKKIHPFYDDLLLIANLLLINAADAEEAVREALTIAFRNRTQLRDETKIKEWLHRITGTHCTEKIRLQRRTSPENHSFQTVFDALLSLEPYEIREALVLFVYRKMDFREIAVSLDISEGTLKTRITKALEKWRSYLLAQGITESELAAIAATNSWPLHLES